MEDREKLKNDIVEAVEQLDEELVFKLSQHALETGMNPTTLLELLNAGMNRVGQLYEGKEYYIADLIMAGLIFKEVLKLDKMTNIFCCEHSDKSGKILLGTVNGDIHDIGKDIFRGMLETNGFRVFDLGVDVPKELFLKKYLEFKPDIIGLSGVLTLTVDEMKRVVDTFVKEGLRDQVKIIVGGDHLTNDACVYVGADDYANCATVGVQKCLVWMKAKNIGSKVHE